jgi:hypothetical protein
MSTRSNVAIEDPITKEIKVIYVHSDGYPDGVGNCLLKHYNSYEKAKELVNKGSASYIAETIEECKFYETEEDSFKTYNNEYCFMYDMRGDIMIEYIYLFKNNKWVVSTMKTLKRKPKDTYDNYLSYNTKFQNIVDHEDFTGPKDIKHGEVKMASQIGKMLSKKFGEDNIIQEGRKIKKLN